MAGLIAVAPKIKVQLADKIKYVAGKGYVKYQSLPTHDHKICKGINQVKASSIKFILKGDESLVKAPKSKFDVSHQVCASCGEVLDDYWEV